MLGIGNNLNSIYDNFSVLSIFVEVNFLVIVILFANSGLATTFLKQTIDAIPHTLKIFMKTWVVRLKIRLIKF